MKIIEAQQAKICNTYKNTKLKLLKTNAIVWFNNMCRIKHLKPNYINIKIDRSKYYSFKCFNSLTIKIICVH